MKAAMFSTPETPPARRWPRGQRFALSPSGITAEEAYRAAVQEARALGRDALAHAEQRWSEPLGLSPCDGVVLGEVRPGRRSFADRGRALDACGTSPAQIRESVDRLVERGLVEALPLPGAVAAAAVR
jgi:hypothetical protein